MGLYNILLVDDEENVLKSLQRSLRKFQFNIKTAKSGTEALELLSQFKHEGFVLIISDQRMPGMSGLELLDLSKDLIPDASKIMITGHADIHIAIDAINSGCVDYFIVKPWDDVALYNIIKKMMERYELITKNKQLNELVKQQNLSLKRLNDDLEKKVQQRTEQIETQKNRLKNLNQELLDKNYSLQNLLNNLEDNFINTIKIFSKLLTMKDPLISDHSKRVAMLALETAKQLNFSEHDMLDLEIAGLLHDIGKISMSNDLLKKNMSDYNDSEMAIYRQHSITGEQLICDVERLKDISLIVRHHHEQFNGSGFPDGLKSEQIPIGARIVNICNFIDNALRKRTDNQSSYGTTLKGYLIKMSDIQFDPNLCTIFLSMLSTHELEQHI